VLEVVVGYDFTCALAVGGEVYCWGENDEGQLGDRTSDRRTAPVRVDVPPADGLAAGFRRACAATEGGFRCWGTGRLGDGTAHYRAEPQVIAELRGADALALSDGHACLRRGAHVRCWGDNSRGQVGNGEGGCRNLREVCPGSRCLPPRECKEAPLPVGPKGLPAVVSVAVGGSLSYALDETGRVWSWGQTGMTLDFGEDNPRYRPSVLVGSSAMVELQASGGHACGRTAAGELWCWGQNAFGELGHPPPPLGGIEDPSLVEGLPPVRAFAVGFHDTCAITGAGGSESVWCWGDNGYGQLGDGTRERRHRPVEVRL
jgi:alpha-tubulin suppressor-like RCC1 family protein